MKYPFAAVLTILSISAQAQKTLVYEDKTYEPQVKTVQLYPDRSGPQDYQLPAATPLESQILVVEFDDLQANRNNYYAKVIHCNYDWTKSALMDLDYLSDYNEYPLNDYMLSSGTQMPYLHYRFQIPQLKVAGNYLLIIYRDDPSNLILSKRFMVYSKIVTMTQDNQMAGQGALNFATQPINFAIDYSGFEILNPMESVHIVMRQNQRWDNSKTDLKPSFLRDADSQLEYHYFDGAQFFQGGNEFRFVDFRSLNHPGQNTGKLDRKAKPVELTVQQDQLRTDQVYAQYNDLNGGYTIDNQDTGEGTTNANYVKVTFSLSSPQPLADPVYVIGAFNAWDRNTENKMQYLPEKTAYEASVLLKQGLYNYQYFVDSKKLQGNYLEGNHFETENIYEILVYNREMQRNTDVLIGYFIIAMNPR